MPSIYQQFFNASRLNLSRYNFWLVFAVLLILTRSQHFISLHSLPGASYAVFLLGGFYLRHKFSFLAFIILALALDLYAVTWGGVDNFCVSPAYPFLLPAYGALWLAGILAANIYQAKFKFVAQAWIIALFGSFACEVFASGGFYFFSGRFTDLSFAEFIHRLTMYYPGSLQSLFFYVVAATVLHFGFVQLNKIRIKAHIG